MTNSVFAEFGRGAPGQVCAYGARVRLTITISMSAIFLLAASCGPSRGSSGAATAGGEEAMIVGLTSRDAIERALPAWRDEAVHADPDVAVARRLASVAPGAQVDVYLGTWCSDSRREIARLFRALEHVPSPWPFTIRWIAVDRAKRAADLTERAELRFVPTVIVSRGGVEQGRIVESAPGGIERALLGLLDGTTRGVISGRDDLGR
jgi:hypothetical protein